MASILQILHSIKWKRELIEEDTGHQLLPAFYTILVWVGVIVLTIAVFCLTWGNYMD